VKVPHILVGVNGSTASARALEWAVVRAVAGHTRLHVVHALGSSNWMDPYGLSLCWPMTWCPAAYWGAEPGDAAEQLLHDAAQWAREYEPTLQISTRLRKMEPAAALLEEGLGAELIVVGRGHNRAWTLWPGADVASQVALRAPGRVIVVSADDEVRV